MCGAKLAPKQPQPGDCSVRIGVSQLRAYLENLLRAFRYRNYRLFFAGQTIGLAGGWMSMTALGWLLYRLTGDPFMLGLMGFFMHTPTFLIAPFGGVLVDHVSRRTVIIATQSADCVTISLLAILTLGGWVEVWHIMAACAALGISKGFEMPARQAMVADIVEERNNLSNAIALNSTVFHGSRMVGPVLAGAVLIPVVGEGGCFVVHAVCYIFAIRCFRQLQLKPVEQPEQPVSVFGEMGEGFAYVFSYKPVRALLVLIICFVVLGQSYGTLLPVFANTVLDGDSKTFGLMISVTGFGAVMAAFWLASRQSVLGLGRVIFLNTLLFGVVLILFSLSSELYLSMIMLFFVGFCGLSVMISNNTIIQTLVDDRLRGRVMSLLGMAFMGSLPLGSLIYGKLAGVIGAPLTVMAGGIGCLLAGLVFRVQLPSLRRIVAPLYVERGILPAPTRPRSHHEVGF